MKVLALPIWRYPVGEGAKRTRSMNPFRISAWVGAKAVAPPRMQETTPLALFLDVFLDVGFAPGSRSEETATGSTRAARRVGNQMEATAGY
jgi:hypothetical protein